MDITHAKRLWSNEKVHAGIRIPGGWASTVPLCLVPELKGVLHPWLPSPFSPIESLEVTCPDCLEILAELVERVLC